MFYLILQDKIYSLCAYKRLLYYFSKLLTTKLFVTGLVKKKKVLN